MEPNELQQIDYVIIAGLAAWLIARARASSWFPWVNENTHRYVAAAVALTTAMGIHLSFDSAQGVLTITGLHLGQLPHTAWDVVRTYMLQQGSGHLFFNGLPPAAGRLSFSGLSNTPAPDARRLP